MPQTKNEGVKHIWQGFKKTCAPTVLEELGYSVDELKRKAESQGTSPREFRRILKRIGARRIKRVEDARPGMHVVAVKKLWPTRPTGHVLLVRANGVYDDSRLPFPIPRIGKSLLKLHGRPITHLYETPQAPKRGTKIR